VWWPSAGTNQRRPVANSRKKKITESSQQYRNTVSWLAVVLNWNIQSPLKSPYRLETTQSLQCQLQGARGPTSYEGHQWDLNERVTLMHIGVPAKSRFYPSRIHALKSSRCGVVAVSRGSVVYTLYSVYSWFCFVQSNETSVAAIAWNHLVFLWSLFPWVKMKLDFSWRQTSALLIWKWDALAAVIRLHRIC